MNAPDTKCKCALAEFNLDDPLDHEFVPPPEGPDEDGDELCAYPHRDGGCCAHDPECHAHKPEEARQ